MDFQYCEKIIHKLVREYSNPSISDDVLYEKAWDCLAKAWEGFDEERGTKFETFFYRCLSNSLLKTISRNKSILEELTDDLPYEGDERRISFLSELKTMSKEAQEVVIDIFNSPYSFFFANQNKSLKNKIRENKNWKWKTIHNVVEEIRQTVSNF